MRVYAPKIRPYQQIGAYLRGELTLDEAARQTKTETHRLVRRQYNWFRLKDERIKWFDVSDELMEAKVEGVVGELIKAG